MHFSEGHATLAAYLIGIVALVFTAIGISLLADTSSAGHRMETTVKADIKRDREKLRSLEARLQHQRRRAQASLVIPAVDPGRIADLRDESIKVGGRLREMRETMAGLQRAVADTGDRFAEHRRHYRLQARAAVVGESIPSLTLPSGKVLNQVTVRGCDELGITVHHAHGTARLRFEELPAAWKERLHWSPEERIALAASTPAPATAPVPSGKETPAVVKIERPASAVGIPAKIKPVEPPVDSQALEEARNRYLLTRSRALQAAHEARRAQSMARGSNKSVPGSLETWSNRAERMVHTARRAHLDLQRAEASLRALSPFDPTLVP